MRTIALSLFLVGMTSIAQIKGNGNLITTTISVENLESLEMNLYANVSINASAEKSEMTITTDSNIMSLFNTEIVEGKMNLTQKEWIDPSKEIEIIITVPVLKRLELGVHEEVLLKNVNQESIQLVALNGSIVASGKVGKVSLSGKNGILDASKLESKQASVNIWGSGKAIVNATDMVSSSSGKEGRLRLVRQPKELKGNAKELVEKAKRTINTNIEYVSFKIKNNSWNRNKFVVVGPRKDGGTFSYGFAMMPGITKKERWTNGTKVYKVNRLGVRKLLVEISVEDKGRTIKLFE